MHPAYSVIYFTTASGAGYGLLALLGVTAPLGLVHPDLWLGLVGFGLAFGLIVTGLLSSTGHLGRKERAWRAFSQWRSSWLSREGVAAILTFVPAGLFALGWIVLGRLDGWVAAAGLLAAGMAAVTVFCTAMIYASLKPIAAWHNPRTVGSYMLFSLMSGLVLFDALLQLLAPPAAWWPFAAGVVVTLAGLAWKLSVWRHNNALAMPTTASATGLSGGTVRSVEWPHTEENYLLKEMGYRVARKHGEKLRRIALLLAFGLPAALLLAACLMRGAPRTIATSLAPAIQLAGLFVERWLFFAEAKHTVTLYYGRA